LFTLAGRGGAKTKGEQMKKIETAAERYRKIRENKAKADTLFDVTCECGMDWKARRVGVDFWVSSGILPLNLVAKMVEATPPSNAETSLKSMATKEIIESIEFSSKVVKRTAADPCIVENPTGPNDISQEDVMTCCYTRLLNWQMQGGDGAGSIETFPDGR
jgi:hypothetical protein